MPSTISSLEKKLRLRGLGALGGQLDKAVATSPDPKAARQSIPALLEASGADLKKIWKAHGKRLCEVVATLCGGAPFLAPMLAGHPEWLSRLLNDDIEHQRRAEDYRMRLHEIFGDVPQRDDAAAALRRFKYYELARITVRDLYGDLVPLSATDEILYELSHLADALLEQALECALHWARERSEDGPTPPEQSFAVIGMGKLGSEELNYSSDVDLVYVCEDRGDFADGSADPIEYYTRVAEDFGRLVRRKTADGFLYRVDLELRPEGNSGPLVVTASTLSDYYERWAETWEKAAFMKARPVAGDLAFGWRVIRDMDPLIYRSAMDLGGVEAIRAMKNKIEHAKGRGAAAFNVKIGGGGIRDIEFIAQALQLVHGGRQPQVRQRSTQAALIALAETGALQPEMSEDLLAAYRFLRRIENRIQMEGEQQVYHLPVGEAGMARLEITFASGGGEKSFAARLDEHRGRVQEIFSRLFEREGGEQIIDLFQRNVPGLVLNPATRPMIENLAENIAAHIASSSSPERATGNLDEFIRGVGRRKFFYELLLDRPELVPRLVRLFAGSEYLSSYVARHPRLIEPLFDDPSVLLRSRAELESSFHEIRELLEEEGLRVEPELTLDALRLFHNRELVNVGLLDMDDRIERAAAERSLTEIAEVCLERGLELAEAEVRRRGTKKPKWLSRGEFLVVAMGKLASRELTYGSDLDVIFLYDSASESDEDDLAAQSGFVGLAQKLIWGLQTRTHEGVCYEIDARLRPSGNQGILVSHIDTLTTYHEKTAAAWERQALLRSRAIAGSERLAGRFEGVRREILLRPNPPDLRQELHHVRGRMEDELARETNARRDFKTGRGGLLDVETVVQYLQLEHAGKHPELVEVRTLAEQIHELESREILSATDAGVLSRGWDLLQRLSSRLRIVGNRSISDLNVERGDLDEVAARLGYGRGGRSSSARRALLDDYQHATAAIRDVYARTLGVAPDVGTEAGEADRPPPSKRRKTPRRTARGAARRRVR